MDAFKRFSLALMAAVVVAGAAPAFSQTRDTRPTEPDRPTIEQKEKDSSEERADPAQPGRLPKGSPGMLCKLTWDDDEIVGVLVTNDTGKLIPAGTIVTVYVQPGGIQKQYKVTADWYPGQAMDIAIDIGGVDAIAACSIKLKPERDSKQLPQPAEDTPWYLAGKVEFKCAVNWNNSVEPAQLYIGLQNSGNVTIPKGTKIVFVLPSGEWMTYELKKDWLPGEVFKLPLPYSNERGDFYGHLPSGQKCTFTKVETGETGPAVEEQGSVPQIDPSKVP